METETEPEMVRRREGVDLYGEGESGTDEEETPAAATI